MKISVRPDRSAVSDRNPGIAFNVETSPGAWFEVAVAAEPHLFQPERRNERNAGNFYSTQRRGWLSAPSGHASVALPAQVILRLCRQGRIHYVAAAVGSVGSEEGALSVDVHAADKIPFVPFEGGFTGRALLRATVGLTTDFPEPAILSWSGDAFLRRRTDSETTEPALDGPSEAASPPASFDGVEATDDEGGFQSVAEANPGPSMVHLAPESAQMVLEEASALGTALREILDDTPAIVISQEGAALASDANDAVPDAAPEGTSGFEEAVAPPLVASNEKPDKVDERPAEGPGAAPQPDHAPPALEATPHSPIETKPQVSGGHSAESEGPPPVHGGSAALEGSPSHTVAVSDPVETKPQTSGGHSSESGGALPVHGGSAAIEESPSHPVAPPAEARSPGGAAPGPVADLPGLEHSPPESPPVARPTSLESAPGFNAAALIRIVASLDPAMLFQGLADVAGQAGLATEREVGLLLNCIVASGVASIKDRLALHHSLQGQLAPEILGGERVAWVKSTPMLGDFTLKESSGGGSATANGKSGGT